MATIVMSADKVIEAATKVIAHIEAKREREDESAIAEMMKTRFLGWKGFYYPTREQAIKELQSNTWGWRSMYAWGDLDHARKLLRLAKHGDPVTLNEEDTHVLF